MTDEIIGPFLFIDKKDRRFSFGFKPTRKEENSEQKQNIDLKRCRISTELSRISRNRPLDN